jgi:hypothetical protein
LKQCEVFMCGKHVNQIQEQMDSNTVFMLLHQ